MLEAMLAACLALIVTILAGRPILDYLRRRRLGDSYSGEEPAEYAAKAGTLEAVLAASLAQCRARFVKNLAFG